MTDLLNEILSSNTAISLISSFMAFFASYKMLQKDVKQNTEDIKEFYQQINHIENVILIL